MEKKELEALYTLANGDYNNFISEVSKAREMGYVPQGGIAMCLDADGIMIYTQAFVKYKTK